MDTIRLSDHTLFVRWPKNPRESCPAIILNDGELIERCELHAEYAFLIGIQPNDRLNEYTPWPEKAIRPGARDFGGGLRAYHRCLREEILPALLRAYPLDPHHLTYGGYSLGGLAAVMSLWETLPVEGVFSLCGSFWYPNVVEFMQTNPLKAAPRRLFLLNGSREGEGHQNRLQFAADCARTVHDLLRESLGAETVMDEYQHHDHQRERLERAVEWAEKL